MKILVLNCGSSSIKYKLYNMDDHSVMAQGGIEKIGLQGSFLKMTLPDGTKKIIEQEIKEHTQGVEFIFKILTDSELGALKSLNELGAVGHRMVHGGEKFNKSVRLTPEVLAAFEACNDLAPLHNPANLKGVHPHTAMYHSVFVNTSVSILKANALSPAMSEMVVQSQLSRMASVWIHPWV